MKKYFSENILLIIILLLGAVLRVVAAPSSPPALNIDEAALGYNAYSIFKTGADEHGRFLPLSLESFGDWKLPVYSYVAVLPVAVLGLSEFSTRFPSMVAGIVGILLVYLLSIALFQKKPLALFAALFFAVSPWSIYFSRAAYEVNLATTLFLAGLLLLIYSTDRKSVTYRTVFAGLFFGLTLFTYHSYIIFTPLFLFAYCIYYGKKLGKKLAYLLIPFGVLLIISGYSNLNAGSNKFSNTTILANQDVIYNRVEHFRKDTINNPILFDKIHTKYAGIPYQVLQNYIVSFSPTFLFDRGGEKLVHNLDGFGNLYIFDVLLLIVGFAGIFYFREKKVVVLGIWLILSPIPSALTLDAPNSTRLFMLMPLFTLISAYGAWVLWNFSKKGISQRLLFVVLSLLFIVNCLYFFNLYFVHFNKRAQFWRYGYKEIVQISNQHKNDSIIVRGPYDFPYIYFLFYNSYDPKKFIEEVEYYPTNHEGFKYVKSFGRYRFVEDLSKETENSSTIYFDTQNFHEGDTIITLPNGDPIFKYYVGKDN